MQLDDLRDWMRQASAPAICTIDGPSGAGKTTIAQQLLSEFDAAGWLLVSLDDIYPGWGGLFDASELVRRELVDPLLAGRAGRWPRWDWQQGRVIEWVPVAAARRIILDGCGATAAVRPDPRVCSVWVDAPSEVLSARIRARDGSAFDDQWPLWNTNWQRYLTELNPQSQAIQLD